MIPTARMTVRTSGRHSGGGQEKPIIQRSLACVLWLLSVAAADGGAALNVWATGDGVRVNPETGRYFEDRADIHKDYPTGDYHKRNGVWDAARTRAGRMLHELSAR